jgi:1,4-alpha-glucan branching enzyme
MPATSSKKNLLKLIKNDPWLTPYKEALWGRYQYAIHKEEALTQGMPLVDFACGHLYFGLQKTADGWAFREWAPNASAIYLIGDFNDWTRQKNSN